MFKELSHKAFAVGGSIRNELLGREAKDQDFVIEDISEEELLAVFPEAKKVGVDFPVFLINGNEVALARTELSTGDGYNDFVFEAGVSIHEDLGRRDLTINSIARNVATGELVDPHNGVADIEARLIRTINKAAFLEDPVRIYRAVRFAVEFEFDIEASTAQLIREAKQKLHAVTAERVELELRKVFERCDKPSRFFEILLELDILDVHFKPLADLDKVPAGPQKWHPKTR